MQDLWIKEKLFLVTHPVQGADYQQVNTIIEEKLFQLVYIFSSKIDCYSFPLDIKSNFLFTN